MDTYIRMRTFTLWLLFASVFLLTACGGGGAPDTSVKVPTLSMFLVDGADAVVADRSLSSTEPRFIKLVLRTKSNAPASLIPVVVTLESGAAVLTPSVPLITNIADGVLRIPIAPADATAVFTVNVAVAATVESTELRSSLVLQFRGGGSVPTGAPTLTMTLVDEAGILVGNRALSQTERRYLRVVLRNQSGLAPSPTRITFTLDNADAVLSPTTGIAFTDEVTGAARMRVAPASVNAAGAVVATAAANVESTALTQSLDLQITAGVVTLSDLARAPVSVQQGQSLTASVAVQVNGSMAPSNSVAVAFASSCGTAIPSSSLVDSSGRATSVIQTTSTGACTVTASAGAVSTPLSAAYTVTAPPTTGLTFVSATPSLIYQAGSVGVNQSLVRFKVLDSNSNPVAGTPVLATLTNNSDGITFCNTPTSVTSGADGIVTFAVCGGTVPATVQVRATIVDTNIATSSNLLTVQTGLPTQRFFGLATSAHNFYAGGYFTSQLSGGSVTISAYAADRLGNPVPQGTTIVFVTEGGLISSDTGASSCVVSNSSGSCSVTLFGQEYRPLGADSDGGDPRPGRVTVLAYTDGEESFTDTNNNNRYDLAEPFEDLGQLYIDKGENRRFDASYKNLQTGTFEGDQPLSMPAETTGTKACLATDIAANPGLSREGTCNGVWNGFTRIRTQIQIVFSGGEIGQPAAYSDTIPADKRTQVTSSNLSSITVRLADRDGNPLPADATLAAETIPALLDSACAATLEGGVIGSTTEPTLHTATLKDCAVGDAVVFKVTVNAGGTSKTSSFGRVLP